MDAGQFLEQWRAANVRPVPKTEDNVESQRLATACTNAARKVGISAHELAVAAGKSNNGSGLVAYMYQAIDDAGWTMIIGRGHGAKKT